MKVEGSVALVTGGASGLGEATVRRLLEAGARVLVVDRDGARAEALCAALEGGAEACEADVCDEAQVEAAVSRAASMGALRVVVQCAGVGLARRTLDRQGAPHPTGDFARVLAINLQGTFQVARLAAAAMARGEADASGQRGVIVNTASIAAFDGQIGQVAYAASKAGIVGMTLPMARDLAERGIRCNVICPGLMDTPLLAGLPKPAREALEATVPFPGRLGLPDEFARLSLQVIENDYLNGATLRLDGALRMAPR